jgi:hypothetical protein
MKRIFQLTLLITATILTLTSSAQEKKASPAATATGKAGKANITINYSAPSVKGRKIWGELVPYGKVWRTGANDATTFDIDADVKVEGQALAKGKYSLFTIPEENGDWTIVFNKTAKQWGSFSYKQEDDVLRVKVKSSKSDSFNEALSISVDKSKVYIRWENLEVGFKVQ